MRSKALITIIIPTFNRLSYLPHAIESVLGQTYPNFELIIVDDGSTDGTKGALREYQEKDSRVRYVYQANQGQSVARNKGIEFARGDYICFLDSDNAWHPRKLERSLEAFSTDPQADIVYGDYMVIDADGKELGVNRMRRFSGHVTPFLLRDNFIGINTTMIRASCFEQMGAFDSGDRLNEDYALWLRFSTQYRFRYVPEVLSYYRVMEEQISSAKEARLKANETLLLSFLQRYPRAVSFTEKRRGLSGFYNRKARYELSHSGPLAASKDIALALRYYPFWVGPWKTLARACFIPASRLGSSR